MLSFHTPDSKYTYVSMSSMLPGDKCKLAYMIGERIKQLRDARGWSQQKLADEMKRYGATVSRSAIAQWESGSSKGLKPENLIAASHALGKTPEEITLGKKMAPPHKAGEVESHQPVSIRSPDAFATSAYAPIDAEWLHSILNAIKREEGGELPDDNEWLANTIADGYNQLVLEIRDHGRQRLKSILSRSLKKRHEGATARGGDAGPDQGGSDRG